MINIHRIIPSNTQIVYCGICCYKNKFIPKKEFSLNPSLDSLLQCKCRLSFLYSFLLQFCISLHAFYKNVAYVVIKRS